MRAAAGVKRRSQRETGAWSYSQLRRRYLDGLRLQLRAARLYGLPGPLRVYMTWHRVGEADLDNVAAGGAKLVLDALVEERLIPDDAPRWVREIHHVHHYIAAGEREGVFLEVSSSGGDIAGFSVFLEGRLPDLNAMLAAREVGARKAVRRGAR